MNYDFDDTATEVFQAPGGKAFLRGGRKTIPLEDLHSIQPCRRKEDMKETGTIIHYTGSDGSSRTWSWAAKYDDVLDIVAEASKILASTEEDG